jgi:hypothetical protein
VTEDTIQITISDGELETSTQVDIAIKPPEGGDGEDNLLLAMMPMVPLAVVGLLSLFVFIRRGRFTMEDIFLITRSGLLIKHVGNKVEPEAPGDEGLEEIEEEAAEKDEDMKDIEEGEAEIEEESKDIGAGAAEKKDEDLIASMFVAVQEFVKDSFGGEGGEDLKRLDYGEKTVMIQRGQHVILATFLSGQASKLFLTKMKEFVDDMEERYGGALEDWVEIEDKMEEIETMLNTFLEGKYTKGSWEDEYLEDIDEVEPENV